MKYDREHAVKTTQKIFDLLDVYFQANQVETVSKILSTVMLNSAIQTTTPKEFIDFVAKDTKGAYDLFCKSDEGKEFFERIEKYKKSGH